MADLLYNQPNASRDGLQQVTIDTRIRANQNVPRPSAAKLPT